MVHTLIIAEAGVNHNGSVKLAKELINVASEAGCDAVKFQTFRADSIVTRSARKAAYQINNTGNSDSQYAMLKKLELSYGDHQALINLCKEKKILFLSSPFDEESVDLLERLGVTLYKIPSGEITNKPLLKHIARKQNPIILSTGMSTLGEVEEALGWITEEGNRDLTLLHCTSDYPTNVNDVNLKAMVTLRDTFKVRVGYSDHTPGIEVAVAAVALGAEVIEKHFTLDHNMEGPDHRASLEPEELARMVESIRNVEKSLGDGLKKPTTKELISREVVRKSLVAVRNIKKGERITEDIICIKRPGNGLFPKYIESIVGKKANKDIIADNAIKMEDICWGE